jgi:2-polyprenyl-6-methoxyphenol hydroxylase-like FAD-dependent oxidoreductase
MTRVAIIGGGIGGLTAASALSRAGIEVAVYEAAAELKEIGAGVALHPNAMKVLTSVPPDMTGADGDERFESVVTCSSPGSRRPAPRRRPGQAGSPAEGTTTTVISRGRPRR